MSVPTDQTDRAPKPGRLIQLDFLRGIAILLVLFHHQVLGFRGPQLSIWEPLVYRLHLLGWTGVDLFFVLSGFLIGGLLFQEIRRSGALDARRFLTRRAFKIWPSYYALVVVACIVQHYAFGATWKQSLTAIRPNLLHVQNYLGSLRNVTWSLAVEEHFYILLPLLLAFVLAASRHPTHGMPAIPVVAAVVIIATTAYRIGHFWNQAPRDFRVPHYTHLRVDGLLFGVLLAYFHHYHHAAMARVGAYRRTLVLLGMVLVLPMAFVGQNCIFSVTIGFTMLYVGYGAILLAIVHAEPGEGAAGRLLTTAPARGVAFIGLFSYSIYLWHGDLTSSLMVRYLRFFQRLPLVLCWPVVQVVQIAMAVATGAIMAKLIEWPSLALRDRWYPARRPPMGPAVMSQSEAVSVAGYSPGIRPGG